MAAEVRQEELEVLESILDTDFEKINDEELTVRVEPEEGTTLEPMVILLRVKYTPNYPDELPDMSLDIVEEGTEDDRLTEADQMKLIDGLKAAGEENMGMAMVYALAMQLKESLTELLVAKASARELEEQAAQLRVQEAELAKPKGTPVTRERFLEWRRKFEVEVKIKRDKELQDEIKALPPKERKEREQFQSRLTGKQIYELRRTGTTGGDEDAEEEDAQMVDWSQYERDQQGREEDQEEDHGLVYSDSD